MDTYTYNHGAQRIRVKRMADAVGVKTTHRIKRRTIPVPTTELRVAVLVACLGPDLGEHNGSHCKTIAELDDWLDYTIVACFEGKLGARMQEAQTALREANRARYEAKVLLQRVSIAAEHYEKWATKRHRTVGITPCDLIGSILDDVAEAQGRAKTLYAKANAVLDNLI